MCYIIITLRTFLWTVLTIAALLAISIATISPLWLIKNSAISRNYDEEDVPSEYNGSHPVSLGIINGCLQLQKNNWIEVLYQCPHSIINLYSPVDEMPSSWKATFIFMNFGLILMAFTVFTSLISYCIRSIYRKSIFSVSGTIQSFAGLFFTLGLFSYTFGWSNKLVKKTCGEDVQPFTLGECTLGWSFYTGVVGIVLTFICSVLSIQAETSTSSDKVQDEISSGKSIICLV